MDELTRTRWLLAREVSRPRAALTVTSVFAFVAIVLAAVGTFGVMSYEVRQRRRELAVRSAISATPRDIFQSVVRRSLIAAAAGITTSLLAAILIAACIPARRAAGIDPSAALRQE
jgi:ABC-type antimicrobial peptide transport system permease subunit